MKTNPESFQAATTKIHECVWDTYRSERRSSYRHASGSYLCFCLLSAESQIQLSFFLFRKNHLLTNFTTKHISINQRQSHSSGEALLEDLVFRINPR